MRRHRNTISDAALAHRLDWSRRGDLRHALRRHAIVHLEAPRLCAGELIALATELGTVRLERREEFRLSGAPEIMIVGNVRNARGEIVAGNATDIGYHSDRSFQKHPPEFTMLYALEVPTQGGDTEFSSLYRLYDECGAHAHAMWSDLEVEHETSSRRFDGDPDRCSAHPLIRRHPDTGRWLVFASPPYAKKVLGVTEAEAEKILRRLAESLEPPDFAHRWRPYDLLIWDNRAVVHRATEFDRNELRHLWRIAIYLDPTRQESLE